MIIAAINTLHLLTVRPLPFHRPRCIVGGMRSTAAAVCLSGSQRNGDAWKIVSALVLEGISSTHIRRSYSQALDEFLIWFLDEPGRHFNKATVQAVSDGIGRHRAGGLEHQRQVVRDPAAGT